MRQKVILVCSECLSRNYTTDRNKQLSDKRLELKKFCARCNAHTVHKETK
ncbi:MAG: 50S ribosomal protein L33 [Candidatus Phytoplasma sp.]|nr:50S ribosomal protein L33 [Phytoplasma sp.]